MPVCEGLATGLEGAAGIVRLLLDERLALASVGLAAFAGIGLLLAETMSFLAALPDAGLADVALAVTLPGEVLPDDPVETTVLGLDGLAFGFGLLMEATTGLDFGLLDGAALLVFGAGITASPRGTLP